MAANITPFFDPDTFTYSYVVADQATRHCAVIDPVLDYDPATGKLSAASADKIIEFISTQDLTLVYLLETHVHADHLSAGRYLKEKLGGQTGIGKLVSKVQATFGPVFNAGENFACDGSQFDRLFDDGDEFMVGELSFSVLHTPGHTPACITYLVEDAAFVGDTLFMPDYGTARTDFPGGDAGTLFDSISNILSLPPATTLYMCHDYLTQTRKTYQHKTTVGDESANNVHLKGKDRQSFIELREIKDKTLAAPRLLLPSIQINMRAGEFPQAEDNGTHYIKIPLRVSYS